MKIVPVVRILKFMHNPHNNDSALSYRALIWRGYSLGYSLSSNPALRGVNLEVVGEE